MNSATGIAGVTESASGGHNAKAAHRWDDLAYVREFIKTGGEYNAGEVLRALCRALDDKQWADTFLDVESHSRERMENKRRRALLWMLAYRKQAREQHQKLTNAFDRIESLEDEVALYEEDIKLNEALAKHDEETK